MIASTTGNGSTRAGAVLLTLGMIMSGTIGYLVVESDAAPAVVVFWRCVIGAVGLLAVTCLRTDTRRELLKVLTARAGLAVAASGALLVLNWILIFTAYDYLPIGVSTVIFHVEPFILIALGALFLGERTTRRTWLWSGLGFAGIVLVAKPWAVDGEDARGLIVGVLLTLAAATLYAASIVVVRHQQASRTLAPSPLVIITIQLIAGAVITSPALALESEGISNAGWAHLVILGLINTALMYLIIYAAYPRLGTATIGVLAFVYPVAAVVVDLIAYGHPITGMQLLGFAAIAGAGIAQVVTESKPKAAQTAQRHKQQAELSSSHLPASERTKRGNT